MPDLSVCTCTLHFLVVIYWFPIRHLVSPFLFPALFLAFEYHPLVRVPQVVLGS